MQQLFSSPPLLPLISTKRAKTQIRVVQEWGRRGRRSTLSLEISFHTLSVSTHIHTLSLSILKATHACISFWQKQPEFRILGAKKLSEKRRRRRFIHSCKRNEKKFKFTPFQSPFVQSEKMTKIMFHPQANITTHDREK